MPDHHAQLLACIPRLRRYARALVGDKSSADDLVQDTLERGIKKITLWQPGSDMRAWLFSIMHNLRVDQIRKPTMASELIHEDLAEPTIPAHQTQGLEIRDLQTALALLPASQREVLLLVALEGMSYEDVALTLSIPIGTVMSRLSRAREKLRALMAGKTVVLPLKVVR